MTRTQRTALGLVLAVGFIGSMASWLGGRHTAQAATAAPPMTRTQYLAALGCDANAFSGSDWIYIERGQAAVGMNATALVCALGAPDNVRTVTSANGETQFQTFRRDGQRPLIVQTHNGVVSVIAD